MAFALDEPLGVFPQKADSQAFMNFLLGDCLHKKLLHAPPAAAPGFVYSVTPHGKEPRVEESGRQASSL